MTNRWGAAHLLLAAVALVVGLVIGGLGPRSEARGLREKLDELSSRECASGNDMGKQIAEVFRGRPLASNLPDVQVDEPTAEPETEPASDEEPRSRRGKRGQGFQIDIDGEDGSEPQTPEEAVAMAREAMELRRTQARAALAEAGVSDEQLSSIDEAMDRMNQDLSALTETFVATVQEGGEPDRREMMMFAADTLDVLLETRSVTRTAERLGVTVSAVSHGLRALREHFDDPLFVRTRRGLEPTPRALGLLGPLRQGLRTLDQTLEDDPRFDPATSTRTFTLATTDYVGTVLGGPLMRTLVAEAPRVTLDVRGLRDTEVGVQLERGEVDVAIYPDFAQVGAVKQRRLFDDGFACLVRQDHPRVGQRLSLATYVELPHALISPQGSGPSIVYKQLAERGLSRHIAHVYGSEHDGRNASKTDLIRHVLATEKRDAGDAMMIGDRHHDIVGANENGVASVGVLWGFGDRAELGDAGATFIAATPAELPGQMKAHFAR